MSDIIITSHNFGKLLERSEKNPLLLWTEYGAIYAAFMDVFGNVRNSSGIKCI